MLQFKPEKPDVHVQTKVEEDGVQIPPLLHGFGLHGLIGGNVGKFVTTLGMLQLRPE